MQISVQLSWLEIATNQPQSLLLSLPIAIGKEETSLPERLDGNQVAQVILSDRLRSPLIYLLQSKQLLQERQIAHSSRSHRLRFYLTPTQAYLKQILLSRV